MNTWLLQRPDISVFRLPYKRLLEDPTITAQAIKDFLGVDLNVEAMVQQVDLSLYRNRRP